MEENIINQEEQIDETQKYLDTIAELKRTSVSRADYDKVREENTKLLQSIVNGQALESSSTEDAAKPSIEELRGKFLSGKDMSNLEYWQTALDLRDALLEKGEKDPFLPHGQKIAATAEDVEAAQRVADVVRECIDYADGDSRIFTNELDRRTVDTAPMMGRRKR